MRKIYSVFFFIYFVLIKFYATRRNSARESSNKYLYKVICGLFFFTVSVQMVYGQWKPIYPPLTNGSLSDVAYNNDSIFVVSGSSIFVSADNGDTWTAQNGNLPNVFSRCELILVNSKVFALLEGRLLRYNQTIKGWENCTPVNSQSTIKSYAIKDQGTIHTIYITDGSNVYYSSNLGITWFSVDKVINQPIIGITTFKDKLFAITEKLTYKTSFNDNVWLVDTLGINYAPSVTESQKLNYQIFLDTDTIFLRTGIFLYYKLYPDSLWKTYQKYRVSKNEKTFSNQQYEFNFSPYNKFIRISKIDKSITALGGNIPSGEFYGLYKIKENLLLGDFHLNSKDNGISFSEDSLGLGDAGLIDIFYFMKDTVYIASNFNTFKRHHRDSIWINTSMPSMTDKTGNKNYFSLGDTIMITERDGINKSYKGSSWQLDSRIGSLNNIIPNDDYLFSNLSPTNLSRTKPNAWRWEDISAHLPNVEIQKVFIFKNILFVGTKQGLFRSTDNGESFVSIGQGMGGYPVDQIYNIKNDLYGAGDNKIFRSTDAGNSWDDVSLDLPENIKITCITGDSSFLFIGTNGLGAWRLPVGIFYPPIIEIDKVERITASTASISKKIMPNGYQTNAQIEYSQSVNFKTIDSTGTHNLPFFIADSSVNFFIRDLQENKTYYYRIKARNDAGALTLSPIDSFTTSSFLRIDQVSSKLLSSGAPLADRSSLHILQNSSPQVSLVLNETVSGNLVNLKCKNFSDTAWKNIQPSATNDTFNIEIPINYFDKIGLEYYFSVQPAPGFSSGKSEDTITPVRRISISYPQGIDYPGKIHTGITEKDYNLLSFPLDLSNNSTGSIIYPSLLIDHPDDTKYRFMTYVGSGGNYKKIWQADPENVIPGKGYWFAAKAIMQPLNTGPETTVANHPDFDGKTFTIALQPGYNQIGNPFLFPVSWNDVSNASANTNIGPLIGWIHQGDSVYLQPLETMDAFSGGYVQNSGLKTVDLKIPVQNISKADLRMGDSFEGSLLMNLSLGNGKLLNRTTSIGTHPLASDSLDLLDQQALPSLANFPSIILSGQPPLSSSFLAENGQGKIWSFSTSGTAEEFSNLKWSIQKNDYDQELFLKDVSNDFVLDMKNIKEYSFSGNGKFKIFSGSDAFIENMAIYGNDVVMAYYDATKRMIKLNFEMKSGAWADKIIFFSLFDINGRILIQREKKVEDPAFQQIEIPVPELNGLVFIHASVGSGSHIESLLNKKILIKEKA